MGTVLFIDEELDVSGIRVVTLNGSEYLFFNPINIDFEEIHGWLSELDDDILIGYWDGDTPVVVKWCDFHKERDIYENTPVVDYNVERLAANFSL